MCFSATLPLGLFTSFASADNSLSGGSKYHHKPLPLLLSEALLRSGSIRSPLPTEVAVAPFTFPFPSAAVVVTEALSGVSASLLKKKKNIRGTKSLVHSPRTVFDYVCIRSTCPLRENRVGKYRKQCRRESENTRRGQPPPSHLTAQGCLRKYIQKSSPLFNGLYSIILTLSF